MQWQFYLNPEAAWEAMLRDLRAAKTSIDFEQYIVVNDEAGKPFFDLFVQKAKEGVRVRVLADAAGSYSFFNSSLPEELSAQGVQVQFFNPIRPWQLHNIASWFLRDHRKILVVDELVGYTGGVGIRHDMRRWRDTHVRVEGPVVENMEHAFLEMWEGARRGRKFVRVRRAPVRENAFHFLPNSPYPRARYLYRNLLHMVRAARKYVYLTTPYFVPSVRLFGALKLKAKRGVEIKILLPEKSDVRTVDIASGSYFTLALTSGVKIFRYRNSILHAKTAVIDETWASVGSANLDSLSLLFNYEGDLVVSERAFVQELKAQFREDLRSSRELLHAEWIRRPLRQKFLEVSTWPIHGFL